MEFWVFVLCSSSETARRPARSKEGGGGGKGGGADLQRGRSRRQRAATLKVPVHVIRGSAARLGELHREGGRL